MTALTELREEVNKLKKDSVPPRRVNEGASTSHGAQHIGSPSGDFLGFPAHTCDAAATAEHTLGDSVLLHNAKVFGPPDTVSEDVDQQVADMVNFLFTNGMRGEDYKLICEDTVVQRPNNCHALAPVECNPEVLEALRCDAKRTDFRLRDVSRDVLRAATIVTKSLLELDTVAQEDGHPVVAREVGMLNGALALLGNAHYKHNLARRFVLKREINHKYAHLCSDKVPVTQLLVGGDVYHSAKQIEDAVNLES